MHKPSRTEITSYLTLLQKKIITSFESFEESKRFVLKKWDYHNGTGGGQMAHLRGDVFEKAAVNFSALEGQSLPFKENTGPFFATGVSLITHMMNPHAPTVHMNVRYIETKDGFWFGGGYDLTPMGFFYQEDKEHFHHLAKETLNPFGPDLYPKFSDQAKDYFYIPHRKKERGVGGIFFDHFNSGQLENDLKLWQAVGNSFLQAIIPIYQKRIQTPFDARDKELQNELRAHYVEFNLIYDRGTKFGFLSGGNHEAILSSMPPVAKW